MRHIVICAFIVAALLGLVGCGTKAVDDYPAIPTSAADGSSANEIAAEKTEPAATPEPAGENVRTDDGEKTESTPTPEPTAGIGDSEAAEKTEPTPSPTPAGKTVEQMIAEKKDSNPVVSIGGTEYRKKTSVSTYLIMGIDKAGTFSEDALIGGQCDFLLLVVMDEAAKTYTRVEINRETNAVVDILDATGDQVGVTTEQMICFAHTYGNGGKKSCENVVRAVSRLLGDVEIDGYVSLLYDAIPVLNDTLGGICVTIEDDFSNSDAGLVKGETVELVGEQALTYIRARMSMEDSSNAARMRRQRTYLNAFLQRLREETSDNSKILNQMYSAVQDYMVTDMSSGAVSNLILKAMDYQSAGVVSPKGETVDVTYSNGNTHSVFYVDEADLEKIITNLFYDPA